jgi:two-component system, NtrC family, nitrogen regulation response regulator NtrX
MAKILIIDDERMIRRTMKDVLEYEKYEVFEAEDGISGLEMIKNNKFDLIFCDIKMPGLDGVEVLEKSMEFSDAPIVMISGHGTIDTAIDAIKKGAFDYLAKPLDLNRILVTSRNALDKSILVKENKIFKKKINNKYEIIGESEALNSILEMVDKVAPTDARVLITGANGTGKELIAHRIHERSSRCNAPFIEVNCAAIPSELIESELFGHEKGSFTSAIKQKKGNFELADGGTLFLDEIGDMSLSAQAKVLRALQENRITRVGGEKDIQVDVRVIAATNKNLKEEIANKTFREDLYHRLSVILVHVPSLNERIEDIPVLTQYFIDDICRNQGKPALTITDSAIEELKKIDWTGNIRELHNVVERLVILCDKTISDEDVIKYAVPFK